MKREIDFKEISDGKLYTANDMVKADCHDCRGCSACCRGMGESVILDPLDIRRLSGGLGKDFQGLLETCIALGVADGVILPHLRMDGDGETCAFLDENERCSVHAFRPGICRMFPLGRYYDKDGFKYFLQIHECKKTDRGKIKVKKWLDIPDLKSYEKYIANWHRFLTDCGEGMKTLKEENIRILNIYILKTFYQTAYPEEEFYQEFYERLGRARNTLGV